MKNVWIVAAIMVGLACVAYWYGHREKPSREQKAHSGWIVVIPGITGDLAKRKLIPALFQLYKKGIVCTIIGTGRREADIKLILEQAEKFVGKFQTDEWEKFSQSVSYQILDTKHEDHFKQLAQKIVAIEKQHKLPSKRLVYLSLPADAFCPIAGAFVTNAVVGPHKEHFMVFEKPFGWDLHSAQEINTCLTSLLPEKQIYRVDHYVAKEVTQTLPFLPKNMLFKDVWNKEHIESVHVIFREKIGVEGRGQFYDTFGAIKDVMQNHMLQVLAYVAVDSSQPQTIAQQKAAFINSLKIKKVWRGQYEGYRKEKEVSATSVTETYAAVILESTDERWKGVTFFLETGKALEEKSTYLKLSFKSKSPNEYNAVIIQFAPTESIALQLQGRDDTMLVLKETLPPVDAYENLLLDICNQKLNYSVSFNEIEAQWRLIDSMQAFSSPLEIYPQGSSFAKHPR